MDTNWNEFTESMPSFSSMMIKKLNEMEETVSELSKTMLSIDGSKMETQEDEKFLNALYTMGRLEAELEFLTNGMK